MAKKKKDTKTVYQAKRAKKSILEGSMLVIDPSSGSAQSLPGYALFDKGELTDSGVIELVVGRELPRRLQQLADSLRKDFDKVDVLAIEDIPVRGHGTHAGAHASLLKSVGTIFSAAQYDKYVEVHIQTWKAFLRRRAEEFPDYAKGDEWDAIIMGYCLINIAQELDNE